MIPSIKRSTSGTTSLSPTVSHPRSKKDQPGAQVTAQSQQTDPASAGIASQQARRRTAQPDATQPRPDEGKTTKSVPPRFCASFHAASLSSPAAASCDSAHLSMASPRSVPSSAEPYIHQTVAFCRTRKGFLSCRKKQKLRKHAVV